LRAIQTRAATEVLSSPRIVLEDHAEGTIRITQEEPVTETVALTASTATVGFKQYASAGTSLVARPHIAPGGEVRLELEQSIEDFEGVGQGGGPPAKTSRSFKTTIRLVSGQTVVLGGFSGKRDIEVVDQVPFLGDIPLIGLLFRSTSTQTEVTRIYVLIRPVILDQEGAPSLGEHAGGERSRMESEAGRAPPWEAGEK
jgi:general secretion pathway protein D